MSDRGKLACVNSHLSVYLITEYSFISVIKIPCVLSWIDYQGCVGLSCLILSIGWLVICKYNHFSSCLCCFFHLRNFCMDLAFCSLQITYLSSFFQKALKGFFFQSKLWNMFKFNSKDTRTTPLAPFVLVSLLLTLNIFYTLF